MAKQRLKKKKERAEMRGKRLADRLDLIFVGLAVIVTLIVLYPSVDNGFTNYDDEDYVTRNDAVKGFDWNRIQSWFGEDIAGNYHPLTIASLALNYQMSGLDASSYHWTNLLLHLLNVVLVYLFIFRLSKKRSWVALFVALIFGIHPLHVESVAWVSERKDLLYTLFLLPGLIVYIKYIEERTLSLLVGVFLLFLLSLLSKPAAVVMPLLLLALDFYLRRELKLKVFLEKIPFFVFSVIFGVITINIQAEDTLSDYDYSLLERISFASYGLMTYFWKLFVPIHLAAMHPYPDTSAGLNVAFAIAPFFVLLMLAVSVLRLKSQPSIAFGFLFYFISLVLVLQFVSVGRAIISERYTYLAYVGLLYLLGTGIWDVLGKWAMTKRAPLFAVLLIVCTAMFGSISNKRCAVWESNVSLWQDGIEKYPDDWFAYIGLGNHYRDLGQYSKAIDLFTQAISKRPEKARLYYNRAAAYHKLNDLERAIMDYSRGIALEDASDEVYNNRGQVYYEAGKLEEGLADFNKALSMRPDKATTYSNRGNVKIALRDFEGAIEDYNKALELHPNHIDALYNIGNAYYSQNMLTEAIEQYDKVIKLDSEYAQAFNNRANSHYMLGDKQAALNSYEQALRINPDYGPGWLNKAITNRDLGNRSAALQDALRAKELGAPVSDAFINSVR